MIRNFTTALIAFICAFHSFPASCQSIVFEKYFSEGAFPAGLAETPTDEYVICGSRLTPFTGDEQMHLSKFDRKGQLLWFKVYYDSAYKVIARGVTIGEDSSYYLLATLMKSDYTDSKVLLMHTDTAGEVLWSKTYYNDVFMDAWTMDVSKVAGIYITCNSGPEFDYGSMTGNILKLDLNGNVTWSNTYDNLNGPNYFTDIKTLNNGGFAAAGGIYASSGLLLKGDKDGNITWLKNFRAGEYITPYIVMVMPDGSVMAGGGLRFPTDLSWFDVIYPMVLKTDTAGNIQWLKYIESEWKGTWVWRMFQSWDHHMVLGIFAQQIAGINSEALVVKMDTSGNILNSKVYEKDLHLYYFQDLIQTHDSGLAGTSAISFSSYNDYAFFKTDKYGNTNCADTILSYNFSDTSVAYLNVPFAVTPGIIVDTISLSQKLIITQEFVICEDDSFMSPVTHVDDVAVADPGLLIYPNPMHDIGRIRIDRNMSHGVLLELYDLFGRKVEAYSYAPSQLMIFSSDGLANGIYFYRVTVDEKVIGSGKLVIH